MATLRTVCVHLISSLWYSYVNHTSTENHRSAIRSQTNLCRDKDLATNMRKVYDDFNFLRLPQRIRAKWLNNWLYDVRKGLCDHGL